jgi:hypothetical protein
MRDVMIEAMMLRLYVGNRMLDWGSCVVGEVLGNFLDWRVGCRCAWSVLQRDDVTITAD